MKEKPKYIYIGNGEGYHGIPARDLSEDEWARLTEAQQKLVSKSNLYKEAKAEAKAGKKEDS